MKTAIHQKARLMKSNEPLRSQIQIFQLTRLFPNLLRSGKAAVLLLAAGLLFGLSASAATVEWIYGGVDRNWSTAGNWSGGIPESTNAVIFGNTDAQVDTNTVNTMTASTTVSSLSYTNSSPTTYTSFQNTTVASGQTLTITNGLNVGRGRSETGGGNVYTYASMTGAGGAVAVSGGNVAIGDQGNSGAGGGDQLNALLDLRGLATFFYSNSAGTFRIAGNGQRRANGEVYLAGTNRITASAVSLGIAVISIGSGPGKLHLGQTNRLFADTITVGQRTTGNLIDFQTGLSNPTVKIRGKDGISGVANWYLGWNSSPNQASSNGGGTNDFSSGILDASVTNLYLGYMNSSAPNATRTASGTFIMGTNQNNSLVVQNLYVGVNTAPSGGSGTSSSATGNFVVGGGTVTATAVTLAQPESYVANGTLTLSGGASMNVSGSITNGGGNTTSTISVSASTLNVGGVAGTPSANISTLNLSNATLGLTLTAPGSYSNAPVSVGTLNIDGLAGSTVIKINSTNASGQYPLIAYNSLGGAIGFDGLSVVPAPGTTATLSNNVSSFPYTVDVVITASAQLAFTTVPFTNTAGVISGTITVRLQTGGGTPINTTSNLTVNLSTTSAGGVFRDLANTTDITSVVIPNGSSSASFRYKDTVAPATPTLTATASPYPLAQQQETIQVGVAVQLGFTPQPTTGFVGVTLSPVVVQIQDAYGNPVPQSGTTVTLTLNGGTLASGTTMQNTDVNGQATFNDLLIMVPTTGLNFTASASGFSSVTSSNFDVSYRTIVKARNNTALDQTGSWTGGIVPGQYDIGVINDSSVSSSNFRPDLNSSATWYGLVFASWTAGTGYVVSNANSATLTLNGGGLVGSNTTHTISMNANLLLAVPQAVAWTGVTLNLNGNVDNGGNLLTVSGTGTVNANGEISGAGGLVKDGANTVTLNGINTYTGATIVSNGTLFVNGSLAGSGPVNVVGVGARLGGNGVVAGNVTNSAGGRLSPGANGIGVLTLNGNVLLQAGCTNSFDVDGSSPTNDAVILGGAVTYAGVLNIVPTGTFTNGQTFTLFSGPGAASASQFASIAGQPGVGQAFSFTNGVLSVVSTGPSGPATLTNSYSGGVLSLSWPTGQSWRLQGQTNSLTAGLGTNWFYVTDGSVSSTNITVDSATGSVFYRLVYP